MADELRVEVRHPDGLVSKYFDREPAGIAPFQRAAGYRWEAFGVRYWLPPSDDPSFIRPPWPYVQTRLHLLDGSGRLVTIRLHQLRGWFDDSAIRATMTWTGDPAQQWGTYGFSYPATDGEWRKARRALDLLQLIQRSAGGSPKGPRKGQVWLRRQCLEWWKGWADLDHEPRQAELAADMEVRDPDTAVARWRGTGLHWPPTQEELDELEDN